MINLNYSNSFCKVLILVALCLFHVSSFADTVTFTGAGDGTSWEDAANWDDGVPGKNDDAVIPDGHDVILSSIDKVQSLTIEGSSSLTLADNATVGNVRLIIDTNENEDHSIEITEGGSMTVGVNAVLRCSEAYEDAIDLDGESTFDNYGRITLNENEDGDQIYMDGGAVFNNHEGATIKINDTGGSDGLDMSGDFDGPSPVGIEDGPPPPLSSPTTFNNWGTLTIDGADDASIEMSRNSIFNNDGLVKLLENDSGEQLDIDYGATFNNNEGADLKIFDAEGDAIYIYSPGLGFEPIVEGGGPPPPPPGSSLNNWGEIRLDGTNYYGIYAEGPGTKVNNHGIIKAFENMEDDHISRHKWSYV